ncbi:MAG: hypothetical protein Q7R32_06060 [Dehalococcoidia bacterium]|nr:hypothetical protein [Dehalococcoidia bacterium]
MEPPGREEPRLREERCLCGNLIAKVSPAGIQIRCRRCKRIWHIPWPGQGRKGRRIEKDTVPVTR